MTIQLGCRNPNCPRGLPYNRKAKLCEYCEELLQLYVSELKKKLMPPIWLIVFAVGIWLGYLWGRSI